MTTQMNHDLTGKRLLDVKELCAYCGIGICRRVLYDRMAVDKEIDRMGRGEASSALHEWEGSVAE